MVLLVWFGGEQSRVLFLKFATVLYVLLLLLLRTDIFVGVVAAVIEGGSVGVVAVDTVTVVMRVEVVEVAFDIDGVGE